MEVVIDTECIIKRGHVSIAERPPATRFARFGWGGGEGTGQRVHGMVAVLTDTNDEAQTGSRIAVMTRQRDRRYETRRGDFDNGTIAIVPSLAHGIDRLKVF